MSKKASFLLRIGVAFAFIYPPLSALIHPYAWIGYFPEFVLAYSPVESHYLLHFFGAIEFCVGVWVLYGKKLTVPLTLAGMLLSLIVLFNLTQMDVLFRDIPILCMVLALLFTLTKKDRV